MPPKKAKKTDKVKKQDETIVKPVVSSVPATPLLHVNALSMRFGGLLAIDNVSFTANNAQITAVIGPNGAGKTTLFNCLTGFYTPSAGTITMESAGKYYALHALPGHRIASEAKVGRTFQNIRLFNKMTVLENLIVAQHQDLMRASTFSVAGLLGLQSFKRAEAEALDRARYWLNKINILDKADWPAENLPYGDQRRLEIARAMCMQPRLLCLDEPAAGLNPKESRDLNQLLNDILTEQKIAILLIEHDMSVVMEISHHIIVLEYGRKIADGTPADVKANPAVIRAYLGEEA